MHKNKTQYKVEMVLRAGLKHGANSHLKDSLKTGFLALALSLSLASFVAGGVQTADAAIFSRGHDNPGYSNNSDNSRNDNAINASNAIENVRDNLQNYFKRNDSDKDKETVSASTTLSVGGYRTRQETQAPAVPQDATPTATVMINNNLVSSTTLANPVITSATSTKASASVYAVVKKAPAPKVISPYSAEGVVNRFFPSESYPDRGLGTFESFGLTLGAIVSGLSGALVLKGKAAIVALYARKILG